MLGDPSKDFQVPHQGLLLVTSIPVSSAPGTIQVTSPALISREPKTHAENGYLGLFNSNRDGANLRATADSGKSWMLIGQLDDGINWYK
jgi:hypothetical protein